MIHKQKEFVFKNKNGRAIRFLTAPFNFEIDEYLRERFPEGDNEIEINLSDVERDLGMLLIDKKGRPFNPELHQIDLRKQDYDLILMIYAFFLRYKKNAYLRQLEYNNETLAFEIEQAKKILTSMPEIISAVKKGKDFTGL